MACNFFAIQILEFEAINQLPKKPTQLRSKTKVHPVSSLRNCHQFTDSPKRFVLGDMLCICAKGWLSISVVVWRSSFRLTGIHLCGTSDSGLLSPIFVLSPMNSIKILEMPNFAIIPCFVIENWERNIIRFNQTNHNDTKLPSDSLLSRRLRFVSNSEIRRMCDPLSHHNVQPAERRRSDTKCYVQR